MLKSLPGQKILSFYHLFLVKICKNAIKTGPGQYIFIISSNYHLFLLKICKFAIKFRPGQKIE